MSRLVINLPPTLEGRLREAAQRQGQPVDAFARELLERGIVEAPNHLTDAQWTDMMARLRVDVEARLPQEMTPQEIEAEITVAREEVRRAHAAARGY